MSALWTAVDAARATGGHVLANGADHWQATGICIDSRSIQPGDDVTQFWCVFPNYAARIVVLVRAFQPLVTYRPDHLTP